MINNRNNKKIATSLILISVSLIILLTLIKQDIRKYNKPVKVFRLFGEEYSYNNTLFALFLIIIASILLYIYTDDNKLKEIFKYYVDLIKNRYGKEWVDEKKDFLISGLQNFTPRNIVKGIKVFFVSFYEHHTVITGRNTRLEYFGFQLLNGITGSVFFWTILSLGDNFKFEGKVILSVITWIITFILFHYRNWAKRFQDFGVNGKVALIGMIPYLGLIMIPLLLFIPGSEFPNKYGRRNKI
jgi:uncharacterized membrane protein YhaH (DUF805 family)